MTDAEKENQFWSTHLVDETFDFDSTSSYHYSDKEMVKQKTTPFLHGEWVRAEDYR
jgi:hypothetical protein